MRKTHCLRLIQIFVLLAPLVGVSAVKAQSPTTPFSFHSGQSLYIVAYCRGRQTVATALDTGNVTSVDYTSLELGAENKIREKLQQWQFFKIE